MIGTGVPPLGKHAREIMLRTLDTNEGSSKELVRIIHKDLGLTTQVLRIANSVLYNHSGRPILSIPHAVTLLGWLQVRNMVKAVGQIEHFAKSSPGLREVVLASTLSAIQSRDVAATIGYPRPEEAYLCGLIHNLGEVLMASHFPAEYSRVITTVEDEKISERAACFRVLDFSWDDVGQRVAAGWNMPAQVRRSMQTGALHASPLDRSLASVTSYGHNLTHALYRKGTALDAVRLDTVLDPSGHPVLVPLSDVGRIAERALMETRETFDALQIPLESLRLSKQAERARALLNSLSSSDATRLDALEHAIETAAATLHQGRLELTSFISHLLDAMRTAGFDRAVFGLMSENMTQIRGRLASGNFADDVLSRFQFRMDGPEGPIRAALGRKQDLYVNRSRDGRFDGSSLVAAFDPGGFALLPIIINGRTVGCLYADLCGVPQGLDAVRPAFGRVRDLIALAIRKQAGQMRAG